MTERAPLADMRIYRLAWLPALVAVVILMFSLQGAPDPVESLTSPGTFEADRAVREARRIVSLAPARTPGSEGDAAAAGLVSAGFAEVAAGSTTEQEFESSFDDEDVTLRNVVLTLPGDAESAIVVIAGRDAPRGEGAASSAAATGILIELGRALGVAGHEKTLILASTSGGDEGVDELLETLPERDSIEAVIAIYQPGFADPKPPFVVDTSSGQTSPAAQLSRTAELAVETQGQAGDTDESAWTQLARLALPSGLGPQAPLLADGIAAVSISSAGERPLSPGDDELADLAPESLDRFGRAVQAAVTAVDAAAEPLERGPGTYLKLSENLVPGWTLSLLALALLLPAAVAAADACARAARRRLGLAPALGWAAALCLPFVAAATAVYALALTGLVPDPGFPFDPGLHEPGGRAPATALLVALAVTASVLLVRGRRLGLRDSPPAAPAALGAIAAAATLLAWLTNPYMALLLAPAAHAWLLADRVRGPARAVLAPAAVLALTPAALAFAAVAGTLELGAGAPWTFTIMVADGQIGLVTVIAGCLLAGAMLGTASLALSRSAGAPGTAIRDDTDRAWRPTPARDSGRAPSNER